MTDNITLWRNARPLERARAVVVVDVLSVTTIAVTAVAAKRRCFIAGSSDALLSLHRLIPSAVLAGEAPFSATNEYVVTPLSLEAAQNRREVIILPSRASRILCSIEQSFVVYLGCLRNYRALLERLAEAHDEISIVSGSGPCAAYPEDNICLAWLARGLLGAGFRCVSDEAHALVAAWNDVDICSIKVDNSERRFIHEHVDDLSTICEFNGVEVVENYAGPHGWARMSGTPRPGVLPLGTG